ncbi:MAG: hypothetical protein M3179_04585 [Actinomycetota bacterium]|nr:hypothetical protein [Actinomycetota bacterium]
MTLVAHVPGVPTTAASSQSAPSSFSRNGDFLVFTSLATDLVAGQSDGNGASDVFLWERATGP